MRRAAVEAAKRQSFHPRREDGSSSAAISSPVTTDVGPWVKVRTVAVATGLRHGKLDEPNPRRRVAYVISYHWLFSGTAIGFAASAMLVLSTTLPKPKPVADEGGIDDKTTRGTRVYLKTPRLRGLLALIIVTFARADGYWYMLIAGWIVLGLAYSASVTPSRRLLRRSAPTSSVRGCGPACGGHHTPRPGLRPQ